MQSNELSMSPDSKEVCKGPKKFGRPQMLIIGNERNARGCGILFRHFVGSRFNINAQYRKRASFEEIINSYMSLSSGFCKRDYVFVFLGITDAKELLVNNGLSLTLQRFSHTNLILVSPPIHTT